MTRADVDVAVIGGGVIAHNSGVIHAGIYDPHGTLKARVCVEGHDRLSAFCAEHGIARARSGALIVAADSPEIQGARDA
jgi:L-2-hydroxyglutarate oxidase LhgO